MLVLGRKLKEKIIINDNIVISIVKIERNCVRLGIEAPPEVLVVREGAKNITRRDGRVLELPQDEDSAG